MNRLKTEEITLIGTGKTIESAFSKAAMNMFEIVIDPKTVRNVSTKTMIFKAKTLKDALYIFIKKIYDLASNETFLLNEVKNINIDEMNNEYLINAVLVGEKLNTEHIIKDIVKQITDRNIIVKENKDGCIAQLNIIVERRNVEEK